MNIIKAVDFAKKIAADDSHGYSQSARGGDPDYDCSSFVSACLIEGGFSIPALSTTSNLYSRLKKAGFEEVGKVDCSPGDIYLTPGKHVVIAVSYNQVATASINEKGTATGGKPGDQTGKEIYIRDYYNPSYGWKYHLRYKGEVSQEIKAGNTYTTLVDLNVRAYPSITSRKLKKSELTKNAQEHANTSGSLKKGTRVTVKDIYPHGDYKWVRIPSGYICYEFKGKRYIN